MAIQLKSKADIDKLRAANLITFEVHEVLQELVVPGVTTRELNEKAKQLTKKYGAEPAFLNYPSRTTGVAAFPGVICASRNEAVVHGIPDDVPLEEGDVISIDYGCCKDGFYGDSARTIAVGKVSADAQKLLEVTKLALEQAIKQCVPENRIGDISFAVQSEVKKCGFGVVKEFVGHGIGRSMHEEPQVPNFGRPGQGHVLKPGLVLAIEPMITLGDCAVKILDDGWTAVTKDGSLSAHFEHTVAITEKGPFVLSRP
jgi:methionyl aminopeptidase